MYRERRSCQKVNNSLCVHNCRAERASDAGEPERNATLPLLAPAAERLSKLLEVELDPEDIMNIAGMCGYDTARTGEWRPWCRLLKTDEWEVAGYVAEVERWYSVGLGSVSLLNRRGRDADS